MNPEEIKKAFSDGIKEFAENVKTMISGEVKPVAESVEKLASRIESIEKMPALDKNVNMNFISEQYRGRDIGSMAQGIAEKASKHPDRYRVFNNPAKFHEFKKWLIDVAFALGKKDATAIQRLHELQQKTAMNEATGSQGGFLVPIEYEWDLIQLVREDSFLLQNANTFPMGSNTLLIPKEATLASVYWIAEGADKTESSPTLGQLTMTAKKLCGLTEPMSDEFLEDSAIDIPNWLLEQFRYAMQQELDNQALNGTGNPVSGVLTAAAGYSVVMGSGSTSFSAVTADVYLNMARKLSAKDRANAKWVLSKDQIYYLDALKDTTGRPLYRDAIASGLKPTLWGYPVLESNIAPGEAGSGVTKGFAVLGDWKYFYVGVRKGTFTLDIDPYSYFKQDQTRFRMVTRWALAIARNTAFVRGVTAAS